MHPTIFKFSVIAEDEILTQSLKEDSKSKDLDEDFRFDKNPDHGDIENEINHDDMNESIEQSEQGVILLNPL